MGIIWEFYNLHNAEKQELLPNYFDKRNVISPIANMLVALLLIRMRKEKKVDKLFSIQGKDFSCLFSGLQIIGIRRKR